VWHTRHSADVTRRRRRFPETPEGWPSAACAISRAADGSAIRRRRPCRLGPRYRPDCDDECPDCPENFEPRTILEISDCEERLELWFEIDSKRRRANSLHKLDTLIAALRVFRRGLEEEFAEYDRHEKELKELSGE
jgi:hypothetical protein